MGRFLRLGLALAVITAVAAACDEDGGGGGEAGKTDPSKPAEATDAGGGIEETPVVADIDAADVGLESGDPLVSYIENNEVAGHFFNGGDTYVVVYTGLDLEALGPLCPGNSIETDGVFASITNAPTAAGACDGITTEIRELRVCESVIVYNTAIPSDAEGNLYASIAHVEGGRIVADVLGTVEADPDVPELDPAAPEYAFPDALGGPVTC